MSLTTKLGLMFLKVVTKPFANGLKERAAKSEKFSAFCANAGRNVTKFTTSLSIRLAGHRPKEIKDTLSSKEAVRRGSDFIAEFFVFTVAGTATAATILHKRRKDDQEKEDLQNALLRLEAKLEKCLEDAANAKRIAEDSQKLINESQSKNSSRKQNREDINATQTQTIWSALGTSLGF
eukprot:g4524.t1